MKTRKKDVDLNNQVKCALGTNEDKNMRNCFKQPSKSALDTNKDEKMKTN